MDEINVLEPVSGEYHTKLTATNPDKINSGSNNIILDAISALVATQGNNQIVTSIYLEFTYIDDPSAIKIEYIPEGKPKA